MECFRATWRSQESLEVSFDSLAPKAAMPSVLMFLCVRMRRPSRQGLSDVPRATRSTAHTGRTAAHRKAEGCSTLRTHTYWSHPLYLTASDRAGSTGAQSWEERVPGGHQHIGKLTPGILISPLPQVLSVGWSVLGTVCLQTPFPLSHLHWGLEGNLL